MAGFSTGTHNNDYNKENWAGLNNGLDLDFSVLNGGGIGDLSNIDIFAGMNTEDDVRRVYGDNEWFLNEFRRQRGLTPQEKAQEEQENREKFGTGISDTSNLNSLDELNEKLYGQDLDKNDPNYKDIINARASGEQKAMEEGKNMADAAQAGFDAGNAAVEAAKGSVEANDALVKEGQAQSEGAEQAQKAAETAATSGASAGLNRARTGMLSDQSAQATQTANVANNYAAGRAQAASTQADYLNKMSQADALSQQASNINKGAGLTALGGGLQMGSAGLKAGMSLFGGNK